MLPLKTYLNCKASKSHANFSIFQKLISLLGVIALNDIGALLWNPRCSSCLGHSRAARSRRGRTGGARAVAQRRGLRAYACRGILATAALMSLCCLCARICLLFLFLSADLFCVAAARQLRAPAACAGTNQTGGVDGGWRPGVGARGWRPPSALGGCSGRHLRPIPNSSLAASGVQAVYLGSRVGGAQRGHPLAGFSPIGHSQAGRPWVPDGPGPSPSQVLDAVAA